MGRCTSFLLVNIFNYEKLETTDFSRSQIISVEAHLCLGQGSTNLGQMSVCLRSQPDSGDGMPAWRRQKPLLPCKMGGKPLPCGEVPLGIADHQEGVLRIHCTDKG